MKRIPRILSVVAVSALSLAAMTAAPANAAVTQISGKEACKAGEVFHVVGHIPSGPGTLYINNKRIGTYNFAVNHNSKLRSGTWKITGSNLGTASSECKKAAGAAVAPVAASERHPQSQLPIERRNNHGG